MSECPITVQSFRTDQLEAIVSAAQKEIRIRAIERLLKEECNCDRYTCRRCQKLQHLGYDYKTYVPRRAVAC